jgi:hypothetical protein
MSEARKIRINGSGPLDRVWCILARLGISAEPVGFVRILVHRKQKGFALEIAVISNCVDGDLVRSVHQRGREIEP